MTLPPGGGCVTSRVDVKVDATTRRRRGRRAMMGLTPRRRKTARFGVVVDVRIDAGVREWNAQALGSHLVVWARARRWMDGYTDGLKQPR